MFIFAIFVDFMFGLSTHQSSRLPRPQKSWGFSRKFQQIRRFQNVNFTALLIKQLVLQF